VARIETERGVLELALFAADAPLTVYNFTSLARRGYFDGQRFHRVVPNFVVQGGDPRGDGNGGPGESIRDELNRRRYLRGTMGMALSGPNTGGSQFFVTHSPQPHLDGGYTVFGQLLGGGDVLDRIVQGDRIVQIVVR
jgi:cyclophilin family peptidyl-prolyl cis-trans isomerase